MSDELDQALDAYGSAIAAEKPIQGYVGAFVDGAFTKAVVTDPSLTWVRYLDGSSTTAKHRNQVDLSDPDQNVPIEVGYVRGYLSVLGIEPAQGGAVYQANPVAGASGIKAVVAGTNITIDNSDVFRPVVNAGAGGSTSVNTPPAAASWSTVNLSPATLADQTNGLLLTAPVAATDDLRIVVRPVVSAPYTRAGLLYVMAAPSDFWFSGILVRDSGSGKLVTFGLSHTGSALVFEAKKWTDENTFDSDYVLDFQPLFDPVYLHITDDTTNLTFGWSSDGLNPYTVFTVANNDFLTTIDQAGWFIDANLTGVPDFLVSLRSWREA